LPEKPHGHPFEVVYTHRMRAGRAVLASDPLLPLGRPAGRAAGGSEDRVHRCMGTGGR
jgi:hypothetical protein